MPEQKIYRMLVVLNPLRFLAADFPESQGVPDEKEVLNVDPPASSP